MVGAAAEVEDLLAHGAFLAVHFVEVWGEKKKEVAVKWVYTVQARSPRPFRFAGIKGAYRNLAMASTFRAFDDCEIDSSLCADDEEQPSNANALREGKGFSYKQ